MTGERPGVSTLWLNHPRHGPLPILLLLLTVATGVVDAVSILALGRVFIANMTGNVVFIGFALAGAPGFSLVAALLALAGFVVGASAGGPVIARRRGRRRRRGGGLRRCLGARRPAGRMAVAVRHRLTAPVEPPLPVPP